MVGIVIIVIGAVCLLFSNYIAQQILIGQGKIESGQGMVNTTNQVFGQSSYTKPVGGFFTSGAQSQINAGKDTIAYYQKVVTFLRIAGVVLIIGGAYVGFFCRNKKR